MDLNPIVKEQYPHLYQSIKTLEKHHQDIEDEFKNTRGRCLASFMDNKTTEIRAAKRIAILELKQVHPDYRAEIQDTVSQICSHLQEVMLKCQQHNECRRIEDAVQTFGEYKEGYNSVKLIGAKGTQAQDEAQECLNRMKGYIEKAEVIGLNAQEEMEVNIKQIGTIGKHMQKMQEKTTRGREILKELTKGALKDRCIQIMIGIIIFQTLVIVTLVFTMRSGGDDTDIDSNTTLLVRDDKIQS